MLEVEPFSFGHIQVPLLGHPGVARGQVSRVSEVSAGDTEFGNLAVQRWVSGDPQGRGKTNETSDFNPWESS